ncbi:PREDICTED: uncharacterized protein LOC108783574 [Cyphomyrmex costatus]|uniref:uncharacterized protein LOC108783574 n=1 Tax=Cyphomyrmex costatus TaxID=456900 RepID=UPI00085239EA|nr:PREDICTED: uncharacterized protein LOC108783574 [Cyphomyrmex costatus]
MTTPRTPPRDQTPERLLISGEENAQNSINPQDRSTPENRRRRRVTFQTDHSEDEHDTQDSIETRVTNRQDEVLDRLIAAITGLQDRMDQLEFTNNHGTGNVRSVRHDNRIIRDSGQHTDNSLTHVSREPGGSLHYLTLKEARNMIPEMDGTSRDRVQEFIQASDYAMRHTQPSDASTLLDAVLCTKLKGKAMKTFKNREITSYEQLKDELETEYLSRRSTAHLQLEFNSLKQKPTETAQAFGRRVEDIAIELYDSMEEGKNHNSIQQQAILEHVRDQALANYQIGLREEIKTLVRSQHFRTLQEVIAGASSEEKIKGLNDRHRAYQRDKKTDSNYYSPRNLRNPTPQCGKCGKTGHIGQNCRTSRYANKFSLPRAEKRAGINIVEKFCTYCKKAGHNREECWTLNGRPDKNTRPRAKREMENKTKRVNSAVKVRNQRSKRNSDSEEASSTSSEDEEKNNTSTKQER